jgi:preprotein translocase subunit SecD
MAYTDSATSSSGGTRDRITQALMQVQTPPPVADVPPMPPPPTPGGAPGAPGGMPPAAGGMPAGVQPMMPQLGAAVPPGMQPGGMLAPQQGASPQPTPPRPY